MQITTVGRTDHQSYKRVILHTTWQTNAISVDFTISGSLILDLHNNNAIICRFLVNIVHNKLPMNGDYGVSLMP